MEIEQAIQWVQRLIAIAIIFQTIELLQIKTTFADNGVWSWDDLKKEFKIFSPFNQRMLDFFLSYRNFLCLLVARICLAICLLFFSHPLILAILLFSTILIGLRWRGTFNGGSDYMTILVLSALTVESLSNHSYKISLAVLWYLAIQVCSSYFIAGLVKIRRQNWRDGVALRCFVASTIYKEDGLSRLVKEKKSIAIVLSWLLLLFEIGFPVALVSPDLSIVVILIAIAFHVGNFYIFGLNRFVFAWLACYPALYFCSGL